MTTWWNKSFFFKNKGPVIKKKFPFANGCQTIPCIGHIFGNPVIGILSVSGRSQEKYQDFISGQNMHSTTTYLLPWVPLADWVFMDTEYSVWFFRLWIIKSIRLLSFPLGWPFPDHLYLRFNKHFWTTTIHYRYLLGTASFVFSKSLWTLKVGLFPLYGHSNPCPMWSGERKKEKSLHMNLCAILVKDFKKQKAKLKLNG